MMREPLDPAAIMAAHRPDGYNYCRVCVESDEDNELTLSEWPCLPYRLAAELAAERKKVAWVRVVATRHRMIAALAADGDKPIMVPAITVAEDIEDALQRPSLGANHD